MATNKEPLTISQPALALAETYPWITDLCPLSVDRRPRLTGVCHVCQKRHLVAHNLAHIYLYVFQ